MLIDLWTTRNINCLFPLKDKAAHRSCIIDGGKFFCGLGYIGETERNSEVCWKEHKDPAGKLKLPKHLIENADHQFTWIISLVTPSHFCRRKILEAFFIVLTKSLLNDQLEHHYLSLLCYGIT